MLKKKSVVRWVVAANRSEHCFMRQRHPAIVMMSAAIRRRGSNHSRPRWVGQPFSCHLSAACSRVAERFRDDMDRQKMNELSTKVTLACGGVGFLFSV